MRSDVEPIKNKAIYITEIISLKSRIGRMKLNRLIIVGLVLAFFVFNALAPEEIMQEHREGIIDGILFFIVAAVPIVFVIAIFLFIFPKEGNRLQ
jgi:hypothetical protein